ncbi:hypothetical protein D3C72_2180300 [compost metagenome]
MRPARLSLRVERNFCSAVAAGFLKVRRVAIASPTSTAPSAMGNSTLKTLPMGEVKNLATGEVPTLAKPEAIVALRLRMFATPLVPTTTPWAEKTVPALARVSSSTLSRR